MSKKVNRFFSNPGNGKAVPQHELDEKTMTIKPKFDENGKRVVHDLYSDIQKFRDTNSLERILKIASAGDLEQLSVICNSEDDAKAKSVDYTKFSDSEVMWDLQNKLNKAHISADDLIKLLNSKLKQPTPEKKQVVQSEQVKKDSPEKVVDENGEGKK